MTRWLLFPFTLGLALGTFGVQTQVTPESQAQPQTHEPSAREVVERLWSMATEDELLKPEGVSRASSLFAQPSPSPRTKSFRVISNSYWVDRPRIDGTSAKVAVEYEDVGSIDSTLRFTPAPPSRYLKTSIDYELVFAPSHSKMFAADGKTLLREVAGHPEWQINGSQQTPWTTVNTAIRYVLESRGKTTDSMVKKNADKTIAALLRYH
jgi:hypothetical protein